MKNWVFCQCSARYQVVRAISSTLIRELVIRKIEPGQSIIGAFVSLMGTVYRGDARGDC